MAMAQTMVLHQGYASFMPVDFLPSKRLSESPVCKRRWIFIYPLILRVSDLVPAIYEPIGKASLYPVHRPS